MGKIFHVTTPKKAQLYRTTGCIRKPVRGFTTLQAAMAWAIKTQRTVIYEVSFPGSGHKLPDHHNIWGEAWWVDEDIHVNSIKCVYSAESKQIFS